MPHLCHHNSTPTKCQEQSLSSEADSYTHSKEISPSFMEPKGSLLFSLHQPLVHILRQVKPTFFQCIFLRFILILILPFMPHFPSGLLPSGSSSHNSVYISHLLSVCHMSCLPHLHQFSLLNVTHNLMFLYSG
jgi:hypothetical protein